MNRLMMKELRLLAMPALLVVALILLAGGGAGVCLVAPAHVSESLFQTLLSLADALFAITLAAGLPLVATSSFGEEFHHRTLTLLLAQPVTRARIWWTKWAILVGVMAALAAFEVVVMVDLSAAGVNPAMRRQGAMFLVMVACSAPLWTLVARSTAGGLVLTLGPIVWLSLAASVLGFRLTAESSFVALTRTPSVLTVFAAYSAITLWLGWRTFARLEASGAAFDRAPARPGLRHVAWLRARRGQAYANLLRKELMLQRSAFEVAGVFGPAWLATQLLLPAGTNLVVAPMLLVTYVAIATALAGVNSIGEDASLGIREWHLTLPVAANRQWAIKLAVSLLTGVVLVAVLPWVLASLIVFLRPSANASLAYLRPFYIVEVVAWVLLGFWASALMKDKFGAAAAMVCAAIGLIGVTTVGRLYWGTVFGEHAVWLARLVAALHVSRRSWLGPPSYEATFVVQVAAAGILLIWQSLAVFRRAHVTLATQVRMVLTLLVVAFLAAVTYQALGVALSQTRLR